jgi:UDP-N-acetylglucosamine 2-epimerase
MRTFGFKSVDELKEFISESTISKISEKNDIVWNVVNNFVYLNNNKDYKEMLSYFDDFNDMKASSRIVNYIETNEV